MRYIKYLVIISLLFVGYIFVQAQANDIQIDGGNTDTVDENVPTGTVIGLLTSSGGVGPYSYTLDCFGVGGADDALFQISETSNLETISVFDFETPTDANTDGTYEVCIKSTDENDTFTYEETITITINNLNVAPTNIDIDGGNTDTQAENTATNSVISALTNTDDGEDNTEIYTYSLSCAVAGADDSDFNILGTNLRNTTVFDYESPVDTGADNIYNICIRVTETNGGLTYDENFTVTVTDVGETTTSGGSMRRYTCKDPNATNYDSFGAHDASLCNYGTEQILDSEEEIDPETNPEKLKTTTEIYIEKPNKYVTRSIFVGEPCSQDKLLTQNLMASSQNGIYHEYTNGIVREAKLLQSHMNRLGLESGREDGIIGPITLGAIKRMQTLLGTPADGYVGPLTRALLNNSC